MSDRFFSCPYCKGNLPAPTRKRKCPHCQKTLYARSRPGQVRIWIKEEDMLTVQKEWAEAMLKKDIEQYREIGVASLHLARENMREWVKSGVVKGVKLYSVKDEAVCPTCEEMHGKVFPLQTPEQINFVMENAHIKNCWNAGKNSYTGCRCYWRPEEISLL